MILCVYVCQNDILLSLLGGPKGQFSPMGGSNFAKIFEGHQVG